MPQWAVTRGIVWSRDAQFSIAATRPVSAGTHRAVNDRPQSVFGLTELGGNAKAGAATPATPAVADGQPSWSASCWAYSSALSAVTSVTPVSMRSSIVSPSMTLSASSTEVTPMS